MSGESELLRQQLEELRLEMDAKLGSEIAASKPAEAMAKEAIDRRSELALQQRRVHGQQMEQGYRHLTGTSLVMSQNGMRVPKFIDGQKLQLWSSRFRAFFTARGLIGTIKRTATPFGSHEVWGV